LRLDDQGHPHRVRAREADMPDDDLWPTIHAERAALARDLGNLTDAQWQTQSLCDGWSVRELLAHLTGAATTTFPTFVVRIARAGFRPHVMTERLIDEHLGTSPADTLARFTASVYAESAPLPFVPKTQWLGEVIVHGEDIRGPLGIPHDYSPESLRLLVEHYSRLSMDGSKKRAEGLRFRATDADWASGEGLEVAGPGIALVQGITGRAAGLERLSGDGLPILKERVLTW
jgi:uncharacterized protein (TIGR03083 family)